MKIKKSLLLFFAIVAVQLSAQQNDWENSTVIGINKEPAHADFVPLNPENSIPEFEKDELWAKKGYVIAWDQVKLPGNYKQKPVLHSSLGRLALSKQEDKIMITGNGFEIKISNNNGELTEVKYGDQDYLSSPVTPNFWRAPLDNDLGHNFQITSGAWRTAAADRKTNSVVILSSGNDSIRIKVESRLPVFSTPYQVEYTVYNTGAIKVECSMEAVETLPELPRFGVQFRIPGNFGQMAWYGRGPQETYQDRKTGAAFGVYSGTVEDQIYPYIFPQENGNKTDVRWVRFTNGKGKGIQIIGNPRVDVSAWPYTQEDLERSTHNYQLLHRRFYSIQVDYKQRGVGGNNSWGLKPLDKYRLLGKNYRYSFYISPLQ